MSFGLKIMKGSEFRLRQERRGPFLTQVPLLDRLEEGGLPRGTVIDLSGGVSSGRLALSLAALSTATRGGESAALIDLGDHLDPEGACNAGVDLQRLLWVRPFHAKEAFISAETILTAGFSLVVLDLTAGSPRSFSDAAWIRLSRAAKAHDAVLLVSTFSRTAGSVADLAVTADRSRPVWLGSGPAPRLLSGFLIDFTVRRRRGGRRESSGTFFLPREGRPADAADRLLARS